MFSHLPLHPNIIFLSSIDFYAHAVSLHFSRISNCILFCDKKSFLNQSKLFDDCLIVADPGGRGVQWELRLVETEILACVQTPPPPILTSTGWYITFWLADFLMKRVLHFAAN